MNRAGLRALAPVALACLGAAPPLQSDACIQADTGRFAGDGEQVRLARAPSLGAAANFAVFQAPLAVNTDGAPTSYHPDDFDGTRLAINKIPNGIAFYRERPDALGQWAALPSAERRALYDRWKANGWRPLPGYRIDWGNVIAATPPAEGSPPLPCIFATGPHRGYFGSLTSLKNGLVGNRGECEVANQIDQRDIPAIVLRGGAANPIHRFGGRVGDLVVAINPTTGTVVPAVIGDAGNAQRIGEGSVGLNMRLLGVTRQPRIYREAVALDTGNKAMIVAVLPQTVQYRRQRPYTAANLRARVEIWATEKGYRGLDGLVATVTACAAPL